MQNAVIKQSHRQDNRNTRESRMSRLISKACMGTGFVVIVTGMALTVTADGPSQPAPALPAFKPAQPIEKMMEGQKKLHGQIKAGLLDKAWEDAEVSAWILAEVANANQFQHESGEYKKLAARMSTQCVELAGLLRKRDERKAMEQFSSVSQTCTSCHDRFAKKK